MKNILISGLKGFVGSNLNAFLSKNKENNISGFDRSLNQISFENYSAIIHLAGKAHDIKKVSRPEDYYEANFELTKRLYDAFLVSDAKKFIFISSVKASADRLTGILKESGQPNPQTHYGKSKLMAEQYIQSQTLPEGKSFFILRPCMIHGPGNKGNLNLLYQIVSKRLPWPLGTFENRRSFLSIQNLCFVIEKLISREDIPSGVYNVADNDILSTNELIELISEELGFKSKIWKINKSLINALAKLGDKLHLPLDSERLKKLTENYIVDNSKLIKALGTSLPVSAKDGLRYTIQSFNNK